MIPVAEKSLVHDFKLLVCEHEGVTLHDLTFVPAEWNVLSNNDVDFFLLPGTLTLYGPDRIFIL